MVTVKGPKHGSVYRRKVDASINHGAVYRVSGALDKIQRARGAHHYKSRQPLYPNRGVRCRGALETSIRKRRKPTNTLLRGWIHPAASLAPVVHTTRLIRAPNTRFYFFAASVRASRGSWTAVEWLIIDRAELAGVSRIQRRWIRSAPRPNCAQSVVHRVDRGLATRFHTVSTPTLDEDREKRLG